MVLHEDLVLRHLILPKTQCEHLDHFAPGYYCF